MNIIGTEPNQVPTNALLGDLAFQSSESATLGDNAIIGKMKVKDLVEAVSAEGVMTAVVDAEQILGAPTLYLGGGAQNLLLHSEDYSNAVWTKTGSTVTTNSMLSPLGELTADVIVDTTASSGHHINQSITITVSTTYTSVVYAKAINVPFLLFCFGDTGLTNSVRTSYDLITGKVQYAGTTGTGWTHISSSIEAIGNGWYRCEMISTSASTGTTGQLVVAGQITESSSASNSTTYVGKGENALAIWGVQIAQASSSLPYVRTTDRAVSGTNNPAVVDAPNGIAISVKSSTVPVRNSDMTFELASNTSLVIRVRGSDGTVRSTTLTLA